MRWKPIQRGTDYRDTAGAPGGARGGGVVSEVPHQRRDVLQMALEVWRVGGIGGEAASEPGVGERKAEASIGGRDAGRIDTQGDAGKKLLTPRTRRGAVDWAMKERGHSQRRACGLVGMDPRVYRYRRRGGTTGRYDRGCGSWRWNAVGLGIGAGAFCFCGKA